MARTNRVVFCGDSITKGNHVGAGESYPDLVAAALPEITMSNIAVPSSTCDSANQGAAADALYDGSKQINLCCVLFGANDGVSKSAATFEADLAAWVAARQATGFTVLVLTMLPCGSYNSVAFRAAVNAYARSTYAYVVDIGDTGTTMGAEAAKSDTSLYSDSVHPTALGNTYLAPFVTRAIQSLIFTSAGRNL